jgi:hypothetical protein
LAIGTYRWDVVVANVAGSDVGRLTITLIPEPTAIVLAATAMTGFAALRWRG